MHLLLVLIDQKDPQTQKSLLSDYRTPKHGTPNFRNFPRFHLSWRLILWQPKRELCLHACDDNDNNLDGERSDDDDDDDDDGDDDVTPKAITKPKSCV